MEHTVVDHLIYGQHQWRVGHAVQVRRCIRVSRVDGCFDGGADDLATSLLAINQRTRGAVPTRVTSISGSERQASGFTSLLYPIRLLLVVLLVFFSFFSFSFLVGLVRPAGPMSSRPTSCNDQM